MSSNCVRHSQQSVRCCSIQASSGAGNSPSQKRSSCVSSGCKAAVLLMSRLPQFLYGAAQELADARIADPKNAGDLAITESLRAQVQALPLLGGQSFHGAMEAQSTLPVDRAFLRIRLRIGKPEGKVGIERPHAALARPQPQPHVVSHAKDPRAPIENVIFLLERPVQAHEDFLNGLLSAPGLQTERQKIAVHLSSRLLKQSRHLLFDAQEAGLAVQLDLGLGHFDHRGSMQIAAPSKLRTPYWSTATLTVRFESTGEPQGCVPGGTAGTTKFTWYTPTCPGASPANGGGASGMAPPGSPGGKDGDALIEYS